MSFRKFMMSMTAFCKEYKNQLEYNVIITTQCITYKALLHLRKVQ